MLTMTVVSDAVCTVLHEKWPEREIYRNVCPENFQRPGLLVETAVQERRIMNRELYEETGTVTLTGLSEINTNGTSDFDTLADDMKALCTLFSTGYLAVTDRAVRFSLQKATIEAERSKLVFGYRFVETNSQPQDLPMMQQIYSTSTVNSD